MKKINAILSNSTKEQYPVLINKLSDIIEPFALHAVGLPPVYVGLEVEQLTVKQSGESVYVFGINGKDVAHVDTEKAEASVFGGKTFAISAEDVKSVTNTLTALHNCKEEDDEDPLEGILENIPRELKPLLGAAPPTFKANNEMDILKQLEEGKPFSGRNGAFTGRVEPQSIEGDTLKVICDKSGTRWHENWELQHVVWAFERGDYFFL